MTQLRLPGAAPDAPLIIGEAPARDTVGLPAFHGRSGSRLSDLLGFDVLLAARTVNLLPYYPGREGVSGAAFPMAEARAAALALRPLRGTVLLAGKRVAAAFRVRRDLYFQWYSVDLASVAVIPHPSGASRFWNEPANVERARLFLRSVFHRQ